MVGVVRIIDYSLRTKLDSTAILLRHVIGAGFQNAMLQEI
jgi:hypothetical protein